MQQTDPGAPGYFIVPAKLLEPAEHRGERMPSGPAAASGLEEEVDDFALAQEDMLSAEWDGDGGSTSGQPEVLCQRCFSLRHAGRVKVPTAEAALPEFDLGKKVGRKIALQKDRRAVVLVVVDASDFDGSLPRDALKSLYPPGFFETPDTGAGDRVGGTDASAPLPARFKLMLALNKVDLLPRQATPARLVQWVRDRMATAGLPRPDKVFCVSANKGTGVKEMLEGIKGALGFRGDLWVVGAQNAGKSSVIASLKRLGGTGGQREPTVAPLAGTTLGLINVPGLPLGVKHRTFDTPGVAHTHQLTALLTQDEIKQVLPGKSLVPRTWRTGLGHSLLLGGLARLDITDHPGATLYLTAFLSPAINCHLGKTDGVEDRIEKQVGGLLTPPASLDRWKALPAWQPRRVVLQGSAWDKSTVDVHIAGLGWVAVGVSGRAEFVVWAAPGVAITTRPALVPDYAKDFCRPGFSIMLPTSPKQHGRAGVQAAGQEAAPTQGGRTGGRRATVKARK